MTDTNIKDDDVYSRLQAECEKRFHRTVDIPQERRDVCAIERKTYKNLFLLYDMDGNELARDIILFNLLIDAFSATPDNIEPLILLSEAQSAHAEVQQLRRVRMQRCSS